MLSKTVIILLVLLMIASLGSAMYYMFKDRGQTDRTLNALKWRVGIWFVLLAFIIGGLKFGYITPSNSLAPKTPENAAQGQTAPAQ